MGNFLKSNNVQVFFERRVELVHGKLALPPRHVEFLLSLSETIKADPYFYVILTNHLPYFTRILEEIRNITLTLIPPPHFQGYLVEIGKNTMQIARQITLLHRNNRIERSKRQLAEYKQLLMDLERELSRGTETGVQRVKLQIINLPNYKLRLLANELKISLQGTPIELLNRVTAFIDYKIGMMGQDQLVEVSPSPPLFTLPSPTPSSPPLPFPPSSPQLSEEIEESTENSNIGGSIGENMHDPDVSLDCGPLSQSTPNIRTNCRLVHLRRLDEVISPLRGSPAWDNFGMPWRPKTIVPDHAPTRRAVGEGDERSEKDTATARSPLPSSSEMPPQGTPPSPSPSPTAAPNPIPTPGSPASIPGPDPDVSDIQLSVPPLSPDQTQTPPGESASASASAEETRNDIFKSAFDALANELTEVESNFNLHLVESILLSLKSAHSELFDILKNGNFRIDENSNIYSKNNFYNPRPGYVEVYSENYTMKSAVPTILCKHEQCYSMKTVETFLLDDANKFHCTDYEILKNDTMYCRKKIFGSHECQFATNNNCFFEQTVATDFQIVQDRHALFNCHQWKLYVNVGQNVVKINETDIFPYLESPLNDHIIVQKYYLDILPVARNKQTSLQRFVQTQGFITYQLVMHSIFVTLLIVRLISSIRRIVRKVRNMAGYEPPIEMN